MTSFLTLLLAGCEQPEVRTADAIEARLALAHGNVLVTHNGAQHQANTGEPVFDDCLLEAELGARAVAQLSDGTTLHLREGTRAQLKDGGVVLEQGEVFLEAPHDSVVKHRLGETEVTLGDNAGAGLMLTDGSPQILVTRGSVVVSSPNGRVELRAGEKAIIQDGVPESEPVVFWDDWTGGAADHTNLKGLTGAGTILGVHLGGDPGTQAQELQIQKQLVNVVIRDGLAETEVDQTFFNPASVDLEGWYWFTVPRGASVSGFAVETNGVMVNGAFVEKNQAAQGYSRGAQMGFQPAVLEWVDEQTVRARIYPIAAMQSRRVQLRYIERLSVTDQKLRYRYPMATRSDSAIGDFSLRVDLGEDGRDWDLSTLADARIENGGTSVAMRRSGFRPTADFLLEANLPEDPEPVRVARYSTGGDQADYVMVRYSPDLDWDAARAERADVVVVVDTSAGSDEATRRLQVSATESVLRALSTADTFALVGVDIGATVLHPKEGLAPATPEDISKALEGLADHAHGGATDLSASFEVAFDLLHGGTQPAVLYIGDGVVTAGDRTGEALRERLRQASHTTDARLFTVGTGDHADSSLLAELAHAGGGGFYRLDEGTMATETALRLASAIKAPTLRGLTLDLGAGLDEVYRTTLGNVSYGDEVVVLARTHHPLPDELTVRAVMGSAPYEATYDIEVDHSLTAAFVPRFWASAKIDRLLGGADNPDDHWGAVARMGKEYGLLTPYSSVLVLDSPSSYARLGIPLSSPISNQRLRDLAVRAKPVAGALLMGCGMAADEPVMRAKRMDMAEQEMVPASAPVGGAMPDVAANPPAPPAEVEPIVMEEDAFGDRAVRAQKKSADLGLASGGKEEARERPGRRAPADADAVLDDLTKLKNKASKDKRHRTRSNMVLRACSDVAGRPLRNRVAMWKKRLKNTQGIAEALSAFNLARASCELSDWRATTTLLDLVARRVQNEGDAHAALQHLQGPEREHMARTLLRQKSDERIVIAVHQQAFVSGLDWLAVDRSLLSANTPTERLGIIRAAVKNAPDDPRGALRLVRELARAEQTEELLVVLVGLSDRGLMTAEMAKEIGDILAAQGHRQAAIRAYSELVEFDAESPQARRALGDIFLAHGWYEDASRQYEGLDTILAQDQLRLALAAGGAGRVDEALRIEKAVASAAGRPGSDDPRVWARLWSTTRLAQLMAQPPETASKDQLLDSLRRRMKQQQFFGAPGTLVVLTWEDLEADLALRAVQNGRRVSVGDPMDGSAIGVSALYVPNSDMSGLAFSADLQSADHSRPIRVKMTRIAYDGSTFTAQSEASEIVVGASAVMW